MQKRHHIYLVKSSYLQIHCEFPYNPFSEFGLFILNIRKDKTMQKLLYFYIKVLIYNLFKLSVQTI